MTPEVNPQCSPARTRTSFSGNRCPACGLSLDLWGSCKRKGCPRYNPIWSRDQNEMLRTNLAAFRDGTGLVALGTITPPGANVLPWDKKICGPIPHRCSADGGCRVELAAATTFNIHAPKRLTALHEAACARVDRQLNRRPQLLVRVWEFQKRGVLHAHYVLPHGTDEQTAVTAAYAEAISEMSPAYGFGAAPAPRIRAAEQAASYCAKQLRETASETTAPRTIVYIAPYLKEITGCTAIALRERRRDYARKAAG